MVAFTRKSYQKFILECLRYLWGTGTQMRYRIDPLDVKNVRLGLESIPEVLPVSSEIPFWEFSKSENKHFWHQGDQFDTPFEYLYPISTSNALGYHVTPAISYNYHSTQNLMRINCVIQSFSENFSPNHIGCDQPRNIKFQFGCKMNMMD